MGITTTTTSELRFGAAQLDVAQRRLLIDGKPAKPVCTPHSIPR